MKVYLKSRNASYSAVGRWDGSTLVVLKGSVIKAGEAGSFRSARQVAKCWNDANCIDQDNIVKKDIAFSSPSTAAQFVTKRSINGWLAWKTNDNICLKDLRSE